MVRKSTPKPSAYGNPQLNIRFDQKTYDKIKAKAAAEGLKTCQDWARRVILDALGEPVPAAVGRSEFVEFKESLSAEVLELKKLLQVA